MHSFVVCFYVSRKGLANSSNRCLITLSINISSIPIPFLLFICVELSALLLSILWRHHEKTLVLVSDSSRLCCANNTWCNQIKQPKLNWGFASFFDTLTQTCKWAWEKKVIRALCVLHCDRPAVMWRANTDDRLQCRLVFRIRRHYWKKCFLPLWNHLEESRHFFFHACALWPTACPCYWIT